MTDDKVDIFEDDSEEMMLQLVRGGGLGGEGRLGEDNGSY